MAMFRTRQQNVTAELSAGGEEVDIGGKINLTKPADFIISHPDGKSEIMRPLAF